MSCYFKPDLLFLRFFLVLLVVLFVSFSTTADTSFCKQNDGSNSTCNDACVEQQCNSKWSCNGSLLESCAQSCHHSSCSRLSCDETISECAQYCTGCNVMTCNSSECDQNCRAGYCNDILCNGAQDCRQVCDYCRRHRCHDSKNCAQTCFKSDCLLECERSEVCRQNCYGNGCSAISHDNKNCFQDCHSKANCTKLVCNSGYCSQKCSNGSKCELLLCTGDFCRQETYVQRSILDCKSGACRDQISHVSNVVLSCENNGGRCKQSCSGSACEMRCGQHVQACEQYCEGGHCNMTCAPGIELCTMSCPGGNCTFSCQAQQCFLSCKNNDCIEVKNDGDIDNRKPCGTGAECRLSLSTSILSLIVYLAIQEIASPRTVKLSG